MPVGMYILIITLSVNGLSASIKRPRLAEWIQNKTQVYAAYKRPTSDLETYRLKVRGWKKICHANRNQKKE